MAFDPDAYLAKPPGAFDPDAYLAGSKPDEPSGGAFKHKELGYEQDRRAELLKRMIEAKGEPGYKERIVDNFTAGLARPIAGLTSMMGGDGTAGENWRAGVGAEEDYIKRAERNTPGALGVAADVVGGLASGGPGMALVKGAGQVAKQVPSRAAKIAQWLTGNTGSAAIEGAARNAESVESAVTGAGVSGTIGGVTGKVVGAGAKYLPGVRGAQKEVNEAVREGGAKGLAEEGGKIYTKLDEAGIKYAAKETPALTASTVQMLKDKSFNPNIHDELVPVIKEIGNLHGKTATWKELQNIRTQISDAKASDDKRVQKMAGHLSDVLDDFVEKAKPTLPARSVGINVADESKVARDLWHRGSKAATAEFLGEKGALTAKDQANKLRTNFGAEHDKILNPKRFSPFQGNPEQTALIKEIATGDPKLSAARDFLAKQSGNMMSFGALGLAGSGGANYFGDTTGVGGAIGAGGATSLGLGLLGKAGARQMSKSIANRGAGRVDDLVRHIVTGSTDRNVINTPREALAKLLATEQLQRGAARYSSNLFDKE